MRMDVLPSGDRIPVLGIGTFRMGGEHEADHRDDAICLAALREALALGYRHFDTAESYGGGNTEELLGTAIKGVPRAKLFLTSKVGHEHLAYDDVLAAARGSLRRLGVDYLDLYLVHKPNPAIPLSETMRAMERLVRDGLVRNIGVSNFNVAEFMEAQRCTRIPLAVTDLKLNFWATKTVDMQAIVAARASPSLLIVHKLMGAGKVTSEPLPEVERLAAKYSCTSAQLIIAWALARPKTVALVKAVKSTHLRENLGALRLNINKEDLEILDALVKPATR